MIIVFVGGIGSGKTLSAVKMIMESKNYALTNFKLKNVGKGFYHQIKFSDVLIKDEKEKYVGINWEFWNKLRDNKKTFSIYLDEIHNVISSRQSTTKRNILMSRWVSQIRKILSDSPNSHLVLITQRFEKLDIDFRELAQIIILCDKFIIGGKVYIKQFFYDGDTNFFMNRHSVKKVFLANPFFKFFHSLELVKFGEDEYL